MAAESNTPTANRNNMQMPNPKLPNQQTGIFGNTMERSRSRSSSDEWWDLPYEADPERMVVPGRPTILTGSNSDSRLNQNRKISERDVDPLADRQRRETIFVRQPSSRRSSSSGSSSSGPSQPRRTASASLPPRDKRQGLKPRFESQSEFYKERMQTTYDPTLRHTPTNIDVVYNSKGAKDVTVHMELDLFNDLSEELEVFNRLTRTGSFSMAKEFFDSHLEAHIDDPAVFVQYAEMLLEQGDFKSLLLLDGGPIFQKYGYKEIEDSESGIHRLELNWKLIRAVALCHSQHTLSSVWEGIDRPLEVVPSALHNSSTELKILSLAIRLHDLTSSRTIFDSLDERDWREWTDWQTLYRRLLEEDRIWDFRDVLFALVETFNTEDAVAEFVGLPSKMLADWETSPLHESTSLALLDILSFIALNAKTPVGTLPDLGQECMQSAERIGNSILDIFPHAVHTRPFIQWVVAKALFRSRSMHFDYLLDYPGQAFFHGRSKMPYYVPVRKENPEWLPPGLTTVARESLEMALRSSRKMQDYRSEAQCLMELALRAKEPEALLDELAHLQKSKQLDRVGYLTTCLSRYLTSRDEGSKASLLRDLDSFGRWHNPSNLINPNTAAAKDVLQRALSQEDIDGDAKSMEAASRYYEYLDAHFADAIDRNIASSPGSGFRVHSPSALNSEGGRRIRRGGKNSHNKRTTNQANKDFGSNFKHGKDDQTRSGQQWDYFTPLPRRDTEQTEETHQVHYSSSEDGKHEEGRAKRQTDDGNGRTENAFYDGQNTERVDSSQRDPQRGNYVEREITRTGPHPEDQVAEVWDEDKWEYRHESSNHRGHRHHDHDDYTLRSSSSSSRDNARDREKTIQNAGKQGRRSRSRSVGRRRNSTPEQTKEDVDDTYGPRHTQERSDQDQEHAQARTDDASHRSPPPPSTRTPFRWGEAVVEEFGEDDAPSESRHEADDEFDVSEVFDDVGVSNKESRGDFDDSKAEYEDAESHFDEKNKGGSTEGLYE